MNFKFYVFGVPQGFDVYPKDPGDQNNYFLRFYDGSEEKSKLTLHRSNNSISYSYLRYNLISANNRLGAFFGMSLIFDAVYCTDIGSLYSLFDQVYDTIIHNGKLLKLNEGKSTMFAAKSLSDAKNEISRIEQILRKNILEHFTNDFKQFDNSFKQGVNQNMMKQVPLSQDDEEIIQSMKEFPFVSISPEYGNKVAPITLVPTEEIYRIDKILRTNTVEEDVNSLKLHWDNVNTHINVRNSLSNEEEKRAKSREIVKLFQDIKSSLDDLYQRYNIEQGKINKYIKTKANPILLEYINRIESGKRNLCKLGESMEIVRPLIEEFKRLGQVEGSSRKGSHGQVEGSSRKGSHGQVEGSGLKEIFGKRKGSGQGNEAIEKKKKKLFIATHKTKFIAAALVILLIGLVYLGIYLYKENNINKTTEVASKDSLSPYENGIRRGDSCLYANDFDKAIEYYKSVEDADVQKNEAKEKIKEAARAAADNYIGKAKKDDTNEDILTNTNLAMEYIKILNKYGGDISIYDNKDFAKILLEKKALFYDNNEIKDFLAKVKDIYPYFNNPITKNSGSNNPASNVNPGGKTTKSENNITKSEKKEADTKKQKIDIHITKKNGEKNGTYKVGDRLTVTAKLKDGPIATDGKWKYDSTNIEVNDVSNNPINVELKKRGTCKITYSMNGKEQASITLTIEKAALK